MNCKNLKKRQRKYKTFIYCNKLKKEICFDNCRNCEYKEYKEYKPIKKRTYKLSKREKQRFSIFTSDLDKCIICGKFPVNKHEIFFGNGKRQLSIEYGLVIPLCTETHHNQAEQKGIHFDSKLREEWHIRGQNKFEEVYPELDFLEIFGRNYK